jgi:hypothetical protein
MLEFPRDRIADNGVDAEKTVDVHLRLASSARMYRSPDGRLHAQVPVGDRLEMYGLKSAGFRDWLIAPGSTWSIRSRNTPTAERKTTSACVPGR